MIDPGLLSPDGNTDDVAPWGRVSIADPAEQGNAGEIETQAHHLPPGMIDIPVDWFDQVDDDPWQPSNNDLDPTAEHWADYSPWWDTEREWIEPHPDMQGRRCSAGWHHVTYQRAPVNPIGLARIARDSAGYADND